MTCRARRDLNPRSSDPQAARRLPHGFRSGHQGRLGQFDYPVTFNGRHLRVDLRKRRLMAGITPYLAEITDGRVRQLHRRTARSSPALIILLGSRSGAQSDYSGSTLTVSQSEPPRLACVPRMLGRLARHGEDAELQCGDEGEGDAAGPRACGRLPVAVGGDHCGGGAAGDERGDAAQVAAAGRGGSGAGAGGNDRGPRTTRTTVPDPAHPRHPDLVNRDFRAARPGQLLVADFTYVPLAGGGFGYAAFVIDAFAGTIAGWECSLSKATAFVQRAIAQAADHLRRAGGGALPAGAVHHSDAGSQYTSLRYAESLMLAAMAPSVGTVGDAYDNALAETTIGLYKSECVRDGSPFRDGPIASLANLERITAAWVHWYNNQRLMHRLGLRPPAEADAGYWISQA